VQLKNSQHIAYKCVSLATPARFTNTARNLLQNCDGLFMTFSDSKAVPESFKKTRLFQVLYAEKAEILRHKWLESEKAGRDIGFDSAVIDWSVNHRTAWRRAYVARFAAENNQSHQMPLVVKAN